MEFEIRTKDGRHPPVSSAVAEFTFPLQRGNYGLFNIIDTDMNLEQLIDQFELVTDTKEGLDQLRQVILHQALRGKLTSDFSTNGVSNDLLKKIKAEKQRQKDEGLITRIPKVEHQKDWSEKFSKYPNGWLITKLGNVLNLEYGKGLPTKKRNSNGSYPVFGSNGPMDNHDEYLVEGPCLVIGRKGSAGAINLTYKNCWPTDVTYFVKPTDSIDLKYSYYLLQSLDLEELSKGIKPGLNRNEAYELFVGIPPLKLQKKIVQKIETLFSQVDELEQKVEQDREVDEHLQVAILDDLQRAETPEASQKSWQRLTDHFEQIYRKPEHIDQLKQAILNEAVRGRLVPQDPNDEPASTLLERIKEEKQRLYDEGEIRKPKDLDPISKEEVPFDLPRNWKWVRFESIGLSQTGTTPKTSVSKYYGDYIPFLGPGDLSNGKVNYTNRALSKLGLEEGRLIPKSSIIMVCIGGSIGKCNVVDRDVSCNQQINTIYPLCEVSSGLVNQFVRSNYFQDLILDKASGSATPIINRTKWGNLLFPLPPIQEQKRIRSKLTELFTWCNDLKGKLSDSQQTDQRLLEALVNGQNK